MLKQILIYVQMFILGIYKFSRDYVVPIIQFIEAVKQLFDEYLSDKFEVEKFKIQIHFTASLNKIVSETNVKKLLILFLSAIEEVCFNITIESVDSNKQSNILKSFFDYLKPLTKWQRGMIYFKIASHMLVNYAPKDKLRTHSADTIIQIVYTYFKNKK